jgi:ssDNA-binding Zn-finger/Zn-ribbon topoisomerase 1
VIKKVCPGCGADLVVRTNSHTNVQFLGCSRYPECKHTEPIPLDVDLRLAGAPELPLGLEDDDVSRS